MTDKYHTDSFPSLSFFLPDPTGIFPDGDTWNLPLSPHPLYSCNRCTDQFHPRCKSQEFRIVSAYIHEASAQLLLTEPADRNSALPVLSQSRTKTRSFHIVLHLLIWDHHYTVPLWNLIPDNIPENNRSKISYAALLPYQTVSENHSPVPIRYHHDISGNSKTDTLSEDR